MKEEGELVEKSVNPHPRGAFHDEEQEGYTEEEVWGGVFIAWWGQRDGEEKKNWEEEKVLKSEGINELRLVGRKSRHHQARQ